LWDLVRFYCRIRYSLFVGKAVIITARYIWRCKKVVVRSTKVWLSHSIFFGFRRNDLSHKQICQPKKFVTRSCEVFLSQ
jgi:hypothetical protein